MQGMADGKLETMSKDHRDMSALTNNLKGLSDTHCQYNYVVATVFDATIRFKSSSTIL